jgi:hypothetical protein
MDTTGMRRGSDFSSGSYTAGSTPATPTMSFEDPTSAASNTALGMNAMNMGMAGHYVPPAPGTTRMNMNTNTNTGTTGVNTYSAATSPAASTSEVQTPHTVTSSNTMTPSAMHTETAGNGNATSFNSEPQFRPFTTSGFVPQDTAANGSSDQQDVSFAAGADFGGFEGENAAAEEEWDAGDV